MEDNGKVMGVDFSVWTGYKSYLVHPEVGLLYYKNADLTDKHYIQNVYIWADDEFVNYGEYFMYVVGEVKKGDYLTTSPIRGAAIVTSNPELAFAVVTEGRAPSPDVIFPVVGGCYASFLKK